ncbi:unnamed protein product [Hydatigera taeniaeformis]|uniref:Ubiquinone biosynthesis protein UbiB n=1 Tax=Hydatigena taeniaeformis TaxID=6205 RepID=A0A0R3X703_HYDTA|nr:unnamed protein product [Hydatigera taeniaeformis]
MAFVSAVQQLVEEVEGIWSVGETGRLGAVGRLARRNLEPLIHHVMVKRDAMSGLEVENSEV